MEESEEEIEFFDDGKINGNFFGCIIRRDIFVIFNLLIYLCLYIYFINNI